MTTALTPADLTALDADKVNEVRDLLMQRLQERFPETSLRGGVLRNPVMQLNAVMMEGVVNSSLEQFLVSNSLKLINENPQLAADTIVDQMLANYQLVRQAGTAGAGEILIIVTQRLPLTIAAGATFTANGVTFAADNAYPVRLSTATVTGPNDRVLSDRGDGTYSFTIDVTAQSPGTASHLKRGTALVPEQLIPNLAACWAVSDFDGGTDDETNAELYARLQEGEAAKTWSNRVTTAALIRREEAFAALPALSIVGHGDPEMTRDQHWIFPVSGGGRCDVYARTQLLPQAITIVKTATLIDAVADGGIWQFSVGLDDVPGFYKVSRVALETADPDDPGFEVISDQRSIDLATYAATRQPDIETAVEGAYSRYQTASIRFLDTATETGDLTVNSSTKSYSVTFLVMPLLADLQTFLNRRQTGAPMSDVLVKGAVPCFLSVQFSIFRTTAQAAPDTDAIATAVADYVNRTGFPGTLHASQIQQVVYELIEQGMIVGDLDLRGQIRCPDGTIRYVRNTRSTEKLELPDMPESGLSARTITIFLDPADIGISVELVTPPDV